MIRILIDINNLDLTLDINHINRLSCKNNYFISIYKSKNNIYIMSRRTITKTIVKEVEKKVLSIDPALRDQYKEAFDLFDTERRGFINVDQIRRAMKKFGQDLSRREVEEMIRDLDADGSGELSFEEFITLMTKQTVEEKIDVLEEDEVIEAFKSFDVDHDGLISMQEFKFILTKLGDKFTDEECDAVFKEADLDHNGVLDFHEFVEKWRKK